MDKKWWWIIGIAIAVVLIIVLILIFKIGPDFGPGDQPPDEEGPSADINWNCVWIRMECKAKCMFEREPRECYEKCVHPSCKAKAA